MDIDSNKKVLGTIRIDPSVPSLSVWSRAATADKDKKSRDLQKFNRVEELICDRLNQSKHQNSTIQVTRFFLFDRTLLSALKI
jgi:hypothetical protein